MTARAQVRDPEAGNVLMKETVPYFYCRDVILTGLPIPTAANLGPGTVGLVLYPAD